jgi:hypothetical protein
MPIGQPAAPPKRTPQGKPQPAPSAQDKLSGRAEAVSGVFQLAAAGCLMTKQFADAEAISQHEQDISIEVAKLADGNEKIANLIDKLSTVGPYAGLLTAIMPLAMQLAANHGRVLPGVMGTVSPEALAAKVQADMAEKQAEMLEQAKAAQQRAANAQASLANSEAAA